MRDNKNARDKQARDAERRQQERDIATELERGDETEPPVDVAELFETEFEFPATGGDIVAAVGEREIETPEGVYTIGELVPETNEEVFDSPAAVRVQVQRPTVAAAMKQVVEASKGLPNADFRWTQRKAYEKTFQELKAIDADDDDEGIRTITDWIVDRIHDKEKLPTSRGVRRQAAKLCRANGHQVRNDEWLGV